MVLNPPNWSFQVLEEIRKLDRELIDIEKDLEGEIKRGFDIYEQPEKWEVKITNFEGTEKGIEERKKALEEEMTMSGLSWSEIRRCEKYCVRRMPKKSVSLFKFTSSMGKTMENMKKTDRIKRVQKRKREALRKQVELLEHLEHLE